MCPTEQEAFFLAGAGATAKWRLRLRLTLNFQYKKCTLKLLFFKSFFIAIFYKPGQNKIWRKNLLNAILTTGARAWSRPKTDRFRNTAGLNTNSRLVAIHWLSGPVSCLLLQMVRLTVSLGESLATLQVERSYISVSDPDSGAFWIRIRRILIQGLKKQHYGFYWLLLMICKMVQ